jgi:uncharacterized protein YndB with AHSA1/START domain
MPNHHLQITLDHDPDKVYAALTDSEALANWFAEYTDVSLADSQYDFWGRYTPLTPGREDSAHPIVEAAPNESLVYTWNIPGEASTVALRLYAREQSVLLVLQHTDISVWMEDFWFLSLENLRRHLDGKGIVRCDYSTLVLGDFERSVDIEGSPEAVWDALTNPDQLNRWIASDAQVELTEGGKYDLGWGMGGLVKILELTPNEKLAIEGDAWGDMPTTITTWTLKESGGKTRLTLVHSGFAPDYNTGGLQTGWTNYMSWIKSLVEYGRKWIPSITRIGENMEPYYPSSIVAAQGTLVRTI